MSVVVTTYIVLPGLFGAGSTGIAGSFVAAAAVAAAQSLGLKVDETADVKAEVENSVDLCVNNTEEVASGQSVGQSLVFRGEGVTVIFYQDGKGRPLVRVSGKGSEEELRVLGETLAKRVVQQYAYHRLVTEMKERNMNIVEEEVEEDGTVRMRVRVTQG